VRHDEIVQQISKLTETTDYLKGQLQKPKSRLDRLKEYAGVVSLVLSLAAGSFAIYSSFVTEPAKSRADAQSKLHDVRAQIVTLDQEYLHELQQGDPSANNGTLASKRNILLQQAEDLAGQRDVASAQDQLDLGNAYVFGSQYDPALKHFKVALQLAGKDPAMKANAETQIGKLEFYGIGGSSIPDGRSLLVDAEKLLGKPASGPLGIELVQLLAVRSYVECSVGDPAFGEQAHQRALDELTLLTHDPAINPQLIDTYRVGLTTGLGNTRCAGVASPLPSTLTPTHVSTASNASLPESKIDLSNRMMALLVARNYNGFEANMTSAARAQVPQNRLQLIWERILAITGPYKRTMETKTNLVNNATFYIVHAQCEKGLLNLALAFDAEDRVSFVLLTPLSALSKQQIESRALTVVADFFGQKFNDVYSDFDQNLQVQNPVNRIQAYFAQITSISGHFDHVISATKNEDLDVVDVLCQLQGAEVMMRVSFDPDMKINAFAALPGK
jgi:Protein of unknown function (DUF3887)